RKTGFRPRAGSSGTASTILSGTAGALGFTGELAADLFAPLNAYVNDYVNSSSRYNVYSVIVTSDGSSYREVIMKSKQIYRLRRRLNLSQDKLASILRCNRRQICRWELDQQIPRGVTEDLLKAIERALQKGCSSERILKKSSGHRGQFLLDLFTLAYGKDDKT
ncbi:MAG: helix-turn-helix transcriptional regulator, partial [Deltaproteobacteria bacterium]|nr:helix-turn-helix transcriptional regulator [Deltaproteobacteria bacterium]